MLHLSVNQSSEKPAYRQLYEQIASAVLCGELAPNETLPSLRFVAKELCISIITVKNAYELLEKDGYAYTRPGAGFFVSELSPSARSDMRQTTVEAELSKAVALAKATGLSLPETLTLVKKLYTD